MSARRTATVAEVEGIIVIALVIWRSRSSRCSAGRSRCCRSWAGGGGDARADHGAVPPRLRQEGGAHLPPPRRRRPRETQRSWWCPRWYEDVLRTQGRDAQTTVEDSLQGVVGAPAQEEPRLTHEERWPRRGPPPPPGRRRRGGGNGDVGTSRVSGGSHCTELAWPAPGVSEQVIIGLSEFISAARPPRATLLGVLGSGASRTAGDRLSVHASSQPSSATPRPTS